MEIGSKLYKIMLSYWKLAIWKCTSLDARESKKFFNFIACWMYQIRAAVQHGGYPGSYIIFPANDHTSSDDLDVAGTGSATGATYYWLFLHETLILYVYITSFLDQHTCFSVFFFHGIQYHLLYMLQSEL